MNFQELLFGSKSKSIDRILQKGNIEALEEFIKNGGDVNGILEGESLINFAIDNCEKNYFNIVKCLLDNGADINNHESYLKESPLHRICARITPKINVVQLLLDRGAKVNDENIAGKTPVLYCNFSYSVELLKLLVKYGADVNHTDKYNNTLLHDDYTNCDSKNFEEFLKILLSLGFNINMKNNEGLTPIKMCKNSNVERILKKYGGKLN